MSATSLRPNGRTVSCRSTERDVTPLSYRPVGELMLFYGNGSDVSLRKYTSSFAKTSRGAEKSFGTKTSQKGKCYVGAVHKKFPLSGVAPTGCDSIFIPDIVKKTKKKLN